jgi:hypothetical protein
VAGYSTRSLVDKLGIKAGMRVAFIGAPPAFRNLLGKLPDGVSVVRATGSSLPYVHFFTKKRSALAARLPALLRALAPDGMLWISWPKKASGVVTDITEDVVRAVALPIGLVDVKVAAIDEVWSGLKLVRRLENR